MLSDEEKQAIERLNKRYDFFKENPLATNVWLTLDIHNLRIVLNLIEKQSKEIEELNLENIELKQSKIIDKNSIPNQDNFYDCYNYISKEESKQKEKQAYIDGTNAADKLCNKKWEDKIKAKIEELDNTESDKKYTMLFNSDNVMNVVKAVLQSLLEKE